MIVVEPGLFENADEYSYPLMISCSASTSASKQQQAPLDWDGLAAEAASFTPCEHAMRVITQERPFAM